MKTKQRPRPRAQKEWPFDEAEARFGELFRLARESGPQRVTKHGRAVVVLSVEEYEHLSRPRAQQGSLVQFFARSPLAGSGIEFERAQK